MSAVNGLGINLHLSLKTTSAVSSAVKADGEIMKRQKNEGEHSISTQVRVCS